MLLRLIKKIFHKKVKESDSEGEFDFFLLSRNKKIRVDKINHNWVEEAYIDYSDEELSSTDKNYLGLSLNNKRIVGFYLFIIFGLFILLSRSAYLQAWKGDQYFANAEQNRLRIYNIPSPRGIIYDVNKKALVTNIPSFAVYLTPNEIKQKEDELKGWLYKNFSDLSTEELQESFDKIASITPREKEYYEPILFIDNISYEKALKMRIASVDYPGVLVDVIARREYLNEEGKTTSLSHILGYEGKINREEYKDLRKDGYLLNDYIGKTGLEHEYEELLRGEYGKEQIEVNAQGRAIKIISSLEVVKGNNIYLTIDNEIQKKIETLLKDELARLDKTKAVAIVMDPNNGGVKAMVSLPGYDNNLFSQGIKLEDYKKLIESEDKPMYNRAVSGEYPSGSTIKPVISAAALQEGLITEHTSFVSSGGIRIGEWFFPDWRAGGHGVTDVRKAIAQSVNTFYYIIGGGYGDFKCLGVYKIKEYGERFGLNNKTGIDLPNEKTGFLPSPEWKKEVKDERWYIGDTYHLAIGQGDLLVTPLQVANYTTVFANKGTLYQPHLIDRYFDQKEKIEKHVESKILNQNIVDPYNLTVVRQGMRQAVISGSARRLSTLPVTSAGKTGTAQWGIDKTPHAWFISFAPYENAELAMVILVEESGGGDAIAVPIANKFYKWYFSEYKSD